MPHFSLLHVYTVQHMDIVCESRDQQADHSPLGELSLLLIYFPFSDAFANDCSRSSWHLLVRKTTQQGVCLSRLLLFDGSGIASHNLVLD